MLNSKFTFKLLINNSKLNKSKKSSHLLEVSFFLFTFVNDKKNCVFHGF